jgi:hypothetical protein
MTESMTSVRLSFVVAQARRGNHGLLFVTDCLLDGEREREKKKGVVLDWTGLGCTRAEREGQIDRE